MARAATSLPGPPPVAATGLNDHQFNHLRGGGAGPIPLPLGYSNVLGDPPDLAASPRAPAVRAYALGAQVERVRIRTPHRIDALLEFVAERDAALLVFGPDRGKLSKRLHRKACRAVRDKAPCLVWTNG